MRSHEAETPLDIEKEKDLLAYLREKGRLRPDEKVTIRNLAGGVSNRTVLVKRAEGEDWVIKQALAKLRVAVDWFSDPSRIHREAEGLRRLETLLPKGHTTRFLFEDHENRLFAMTAVSKPHENWKDVLLDGRLEPAHVRQFGSLLGTLHRRGWEQRVETAAAFEDRTFFETLRLEPYYLYTAGRVGEAAPFLEALVEETRSLRLTLVHGDYSPKNILIHRDKLVLLDHEVIHFGDPGFDLGFSLAHLLSKAHHLPARREAFAAAVALYRESYLGSLGRPDWIDGLETRAVRHTLGCLLARVDGRSTLEYLDGAERARQREAVLPLMKRPPEGIRELAAAFAESL